MKFHDAQWITRYRIAQFVTRVAERIAPRSADPPPMAVYYPQHHSCQIPTVHELYSRYLGEREDGVFVEVGAYDGVYYGNTWGLAVRGWTGVMVEPVPAYAELCRQNHRDHPGIRVVELAIADRDDDEITLQVGGVLTSANPAVFDEYKDKPWARAITDDVVVAKTQRLDTLLEQQAVPPDFDLLVADTEGLEMEVFSGFALARWRPKMLIVELTDVHPELTATAQDDAVLGRSIAAGGYVIVYKDRLNTVFVRSDVYDGATGSVARPQ